MGDEGPGLEIVACGQAAGIAGAETGEVFGSGGAEVPLRVLCECQSSAKWICEVEDEKGRVSKKVKKQKEGGGGGGGGG